MEERKICKDCRWFNPGDSMDPRQGRCFRPRGESEMHSKEQVGRVASKFINGHQDASNCPNYEYIDKRSEKDWMRRITI